MLEITGVNDTVAHSVRVEIDEYVPIRVRSHGAPIGARYVRFTDSKSSLLELLLDESMTIRGFTLTLFEGVHDVLDIATLPERSGLPVVSLAAGQSSERITGTERIDIRDRFSVGFGPDFAEIDLGPLLSATGVISSGPVAFYVHNNTLAGIRVGGLSKSDLAMIRAASAMP